ncbi:sensor histidine kinase [Desertivirga arenae]|uniref:sensor histidine kinase n=1 Tax=Desertivirga arenae TaxID=2810309 RepID=UPI001A974A4F|nr:ATP-binding protein [Pedobacter sp. SYSU D00823]
MDNQGNHHKDNNSGKESSPIDLVALFGEVEEVANMGIYRVELPGMKFYFSDGLFRLFGEAPQSFEPSLEYINSRSTAADAENVDRVLSQAAIDKKPYTYVRRILRRDGEWRTLKSHGKVICDEAGNAISYIGIVLDITKQKKAEKKIQGNRELLQSVFDTSLIGMSVFKSVRNESNEIVDFKILIVNRLIEQNTGRTDLVGKLYLQEYPGIKQAGIFDKMCEVMNTGLPSQMEYKYDVEGFNNWFLTMFVRQNDNLVATTLDITDKKRDEEEKDRNFMLLQQTEQVSSMGSWSFDTKKQEMNWSEGMYNLFHLQPGSKVSPETYLQFIVPEDRSKLQEQVINKIVEELREFNEQLTFLIQGERRLIHIKATPITDPSGQEVHMVGIDMDNTEKNSAEEKLRENEFMKMLLEKKDEFMSVASHELKTPITTLKASLQILCRLIEKHTEENVLLVFATKANQQVNKVIRLISDLMDNAKIQAGKINLNLDTFLLDEVIEDCIAFQSGGHEIIVNNNVSEQIEGDKHRIEQVLTNFLSNAIKYSPSGKQIIITASQEKDGVKVEVKDFGIGIPPSKIDHVFDRFFRVDDKSQEFSGLGLGLYISAEIIKKHGGTYGVVSEPGKGSTFWFAIPLKHSSITASE